MSLPESSVAPPAGFSPQVLSRLADLEASLQAAIRGKNEVVRLSLVCLLARGHLLIEDLPGMGKTTLAERLEEELWAAGHGVYRLDGDILRKGPCSDLGFSLSDRRENIRRAGEVACLLADAGLVAVAALILEEPPERQLLVVVPVVLAKLHLMQELQIQAVVAVAQLVAIL